MVERAEATASRLAGRLASAMGMVDASPATRLKALSRVLLGSAGLAVLLPAGLSFVLGPATALPAGLALAAAGGLVGASLVFSMRAPASTSARKPEPAEPETDLIIILTDEDGRIAGRRGQDREALAPRLAPLSGAFVEKLHVSDRIAFLTAFDDLRQAGGRSRLRVRFMAGPAEDGQFIAADLSLAARIDADGRFAGVAIELVDRSAEQALEARLERFENDLALANETKTRFLAAVSHELRTPLNAILGFSDILIGGYFGELSDPRQREYVGLINQSGQHLLSVVNSMLDMSKIEAGRYELIREPYIFAESLMSVEDMMALEARRKGVQLTARAARDIGEIHADRRAIKQVLINLVGNAIKFTGEGGVVTVDAIRRGDQLEIKVSDTGIGIPADKLAMLGQPFVQVQSEYTRRFEGTGLGLSLVKGLVGLHGGTFDIASREGEGTVVTVTIPADEADGLADNSGEETFPPRLPRLDAHEMMVDKEEGHGRKQAKTA